MPILRVVSWPDALQSRDGTEQGGGLIAARCRGVGVLHPTPAQHFASVERRMVPVRSGKMS